MNRRQREAVGSASISTRHRQSSLACRRLVPLPSASLQASRAPPATESPEKLQGLRAPASWLLDDEPDSLALILYSHEARD